MKVANDILKGLTEALEWVQGKRKNKKVEHIICDECYGAGTFGPFYIAPPKRNKCNKCQGTGFIRIIKKRYKK